MRALPEQQQQYILSYINLPVQISQGLVTAKAQLSREDLTIPRLELEAMPMAANLCQNLKSVLERKTIRKKYGWTDSSVALHWVTSKGTYKQFVSNMVKEIQKNSYIQWWCIPTEENPPYVASRGIYLIIAGLDLNGCKILPTDIVTKLTNKTESEAKVIKKILSVAVEKDDQQDGLLPKYRLCKTLSIKSWIIRFITNCRAPSKGRIRGPIIMSSIVKWGNEDNLSLFIFF